MDSYQDIVRDREAHGNVDIDMDTDTCHVRVNDEHAVSGL